jgi:hypothetical protein
MTSITLLIDHAAINQALHAQKLKSTAHLWCLDAEILKLQVLKNVAIQSSL